MSLWLDHFFVLTEPGAPKADSLVEVGFVEGPTNSHPGQGTANRRFFFANTTLELLYVRDETEASGGPAARFHFPERIRNEGASPFGFVFRSTNSDAARALGDVWRYQPDYLPQNSHMVVAASPESLVEPCLVIMPSTMRKGEHKAHTNSQSLSRLCLTVPASTFSSALRNISTLDPLHIRHGDEHLLEIEFDRGIQGMFTSFRPQLPLTVRY